MKTLVYLTLFTTLSRQTTTAQDSAFCYPGVTPGPMRNVTEPHRTWHPKESPARTKRYEVPDPGAARPVSRGAAERQNELRRSLSPCNGQPRKLTLQGGVSLAAARKLCADALHEVAQGRDPVEAKKAHKAQTAAAAVNTVQFVCEEFLRREGGGLRTRNPRERLLKLHVYPRIGKKLIHEVKRSEINRMLGYKLANDGQDTRAIQHYLGHRSINSTVRYTALAPDRFKGFWKD